MAQEPTIDQQQELMMMNLILMLSENGWILLGKRVNPATGKEETDLRGARAMIDTLAVLKERTEGRLTERERALLENQLTNLRLTYVETAKVAPAQAQA